jgi:TolB-like protein/Flp pilus assembly protein TadD
MAKIPESSPTYPVPERVICQMEAILASETFVNAPQLRKFLRYMVERTLQGDTDGLKEYQVGLEVFARNGTYDTRIDPVVRVEARRLRSKLAEYYADQGCNDEIVISLPKGGYVGRFEQRPPSVEPLAAPSLTVPVSRRVHPALVVSACIFVGVALLSGFFVLKSSHDATPSIAVLPFANLSSDPANQYFADGLTDEITDALSRLKTLRVIARSSAFTFKGKVVDVREVGRQLHVATVLEGSVERYGSRVKIVAQLARASDGSQIWSGTYERQTSDLFSMQSELAAGIAGSLKAAAREARAVNHVPSADAHDHFMKGYYQLELETPESLDRAEQDFQQAIDLDPDYAAAYNGLGAAKFNRAVANLTDRTSAELEASERLLRKALDLDPDLAVARSNLALIAMQYDWDWGRAEREIQTALSSAPSSAAESTYAMLLAYRGRFSEADDHLRRAQDLDPLGVLQLTRSCAIRLTQGRLAQAREECQKITARYPTMIQPAIMANSIYLLEGRPDQALPVFQQMENRYPQVRLFEAMAKARSGQRNEALKLIRPFEENYQNGGVPRQWFALVYGFLGDEKNALLWLERSADLREFQVLNFAVNPVFARMQNNPGFRALKKRMGLAR